MDSADLHHSRALAEQHCNRGELDCRWYHGNWELLKALGVVSSSAVHAKELRELLLKALPAGKANPSIFISGATDATLLEILHSTCLDAGVQPVVTAVDVCATPLVLMAEYAARHDLAFSKTRADLLAYPADSQYDVIFTHVFMGYFDARQRATLLRKWASLLADGGRVATVQRLRPPDSPPIVGFSPEQARHFRAAARDAAANLDHLPAEERARVDDAAAVFTENLRNHVITSREDLERLFTDAGLRFSHLEYQSLEKRSNLGGPAVPSGGNYAFIVAEKDVKS